MFLSISSLIYCSLIPLNLVVEIFYLLKLKASPKLVSGVLEVETDTCVTLSPLKRLLGDISPFGRFGVRFYFESRLCISGNIDSRWIRFGAATQKQCQVKLWNFNLTFAIAAHFICVTLLIQPCLATLLSIHKITSPDGTYCFPNEYGLGYFPCWDVWEWLSEAHCKISTKLS